MSYSSENFRDLIVKDHGTLINKNQEEYNNNNYECTTPTAASHFKHPMSAVSQNFQNGSNV